VENKVGELPSRKPVKSSSPVPNDVDAHEIAVEEVIRLTQGTRIKEKSGPSAPENRRMKVDYGDVEASTGERIEVKSCFAKFGGNSLAGQYEFGDLLGTGTNPKDYDWLFCVGIQDGRDGYEFKIFVFKYDVMKKMTEGRLNRKISCSAIPFVEPHQSVLGFRDWKIPNVNNKVSNRIWMHHWSEEKITTRFFARVKGKPAWTSSWIP
jgi:hypothetical protein